AVLLDDAEEETEIVRGESAVEAEEDLRSGIGDRHERLERLSRPRSLERAVLVLEVVVCDDALGRERPVLPGVTEPEIGEARRLRHEEGERGLVDGDRARDA